MAAGLSQIGGGGGLKKVKETKLPEPEKPAPMPDQEELRNKAKIEAAKRKTTGRSSTILSDYESLG
jgi:hypothetical protein